MHVSLSFDCSPYLMFLGMVVKMVVVMGLGMELGIELGMEFFVGMGTLSVLRWV